MSQPIKYFTQTTHQVDDILDDEIITTKDDVTRRYLVHWKGKLPTDDTWEYQSELQQIDPDILEHMKVHQFWLDRAEFFVDSHKIKDKIIKHRVQISQKREAYSS